MACEGLRGVAGWLCEHEIFPYGPLVSAPHAAWLCEHGFHRWETIQHHNVRSKVAPSWVSVTFSQRSERCRRCGTERTVTASPRT